MDLFVETVANFFTSYLVRSNHYINNFGDAFRKIVRCKGKISDNTNLYWLFNKQGNDVNLNSCSEVSRLFFNMIFYIIERDLIDGKLSVDMMLNVWEDGVKNYFGSDTEIKQEYILNNENWALGKFGIPGFQSIAIVNGSMMFDQYSRKFSNKEYDRNIIRKFLANINSTSVEYSAYATMEETMNNVEIFVKCYKERFV